MGRRPTPTATLKLRGSWRAKAREKQGDLAPTAGEIEPLPSVAGCPQALALFNSIVRPLKDQGLAGCSDSLALSLLASELAAGQIATERMNASGGAVIGGRINPWFTAMMQSNKLAFKIMNEFGMTALARTKLGGKAKPERQPDSIAQMFKFNAGS